MSAEWFCVGLLLVLLIGCQVYWARIVMQLTNKLMSRNYFEYVQTKRLAEQPQVVREESKADDYLVDPEDERSAQSLNHIIGAI